MSAEHKARALAISCIDFRFQEMIDEDLARHHLNGNCDRIAWPGASKDHDNVLKTATLSLKLHDPDKLYIYEHEDCGAYGQDNSLQAHRQNARNLANSLKEIKSTLAVTILIATFNGIRPL